MEIFMCIVAAIFGAATLVKEEDRETYAMCFCVSAICMVALAILS